MATKTLEVALLQLGDASNGIKLVVSTVTEAERLSDHLHEAHKSGKPVNVSLKASVVKPRPNLILSS